MIVRDMSKSMRQRVAMENALAAASRRLCELSRHLVETQEDARRRLSGELHDLTSSNLAAININMTLISDVVAQASSPEVVGRLADTLALIEDTEVSIRNICADLRSPVMDYAGLAASMQAYADQFVKRSGITVKVDCLNASIRLRPALESLLFRIFQEALTNSLKHAKATSIQVTVDLKARPIVLTISDDGVGFDTALVDKSGASGMGLRNMQEMAELASGELFIRSRPGAGTQLIARIQA
jgi:signal transduction histidine kinase